MLEEGRIIPNSNMCSNSLRATWRRSGDKRRARAETSGPVVLIWCVTSCFGGVLVGCGCEKVNEQRFKLVSRGAREKGEAGCGPSRGNAMNG